MNLKHFLMEKIVIIDYGAGNIHSINKALLKVSNGEKQIAISNKEADILKADKLILPGVGAFGSCMEKLTSLKLVPIIKDRVLNGKIPFLGICLGMQLLGSKGYEFGETEGLGLIEGEVKLIKTKEKVEIPHMGWNSVSSTNHPLFNNIKNESDFYFVHSYHFIAKSKDAVIATTSYGGVKLVAGIAKDNIMGVQFHPEKSSDSGLTLLKNFVFL